MTSTEKKKGEKISPPSRARRRGSEMERMQKRIVTEKEKLEEERKEMEKKQEWEREWRGSATLLRMEISISGEREGGAPRRKIFSREGERTIWRERDHRREKEIYIERE